MKAYPLQWPAGWPKTDKAAREKGLFKQTLSGALAKLKYEIGLMGGNGIILSSNCALGEDRPADPGVCAYFTFENQQVAIPCDRWKLVEHNIHAIALTIMAMRGMNRWGAKHMVSAMFTGFKALPQKAGGADYYALLDLDRNTKLTEVELTAAFRRQGKIFHPDVPQTGNAEKFRDIREAHDMLMQTVTK